MTSTRREKLEAMLANDPADQMLRYMLAMELQKEDAHDRSLELFDGLMNDDTPHVASFLMAGQQLAQLGRIDEARATYQKGIEQANLQGDDHPAGEMGQFMMEL